MPKRKISSKSFKDLQTEISPRIFLESIKSNFKDFPDPRITKRCVYPIWYIFLVTLSGYLAGCNTVADIAQEISHGRKEKRSVCVVNAIDWLPQKQEWQLQSLIEICSERIAGGKVENEIRYYVSSRKANAETFSKWIREHWGIENSLHYVMDVVFKEDNQLCDVGYSAENMALIRRLTANIIRTFDPETGITDARRNATYEPNYLRGLLAKMFVK
jgi:hypothetical protein